MQPLQMNESLMAPRSKYKHGLISKVTSPLVYGALLWAGGRLRMIWSVSPFALELDFALSLSLSLVIYIISLPSPLTLVVWGWRNWRRIH